MNIVADLIARHGGMDGGADDMPGMNMTANSSASMGGMDHMSMGGNSCKISMMWNWYTIDSCFLSKSWHVTSKAQFGGSVIGVFFLCMAIEAVRRSAREYDRRLTLAARAIPSNWDAAGFFQPTVTQHIIRSLMYGVQFTAAFLVMLLGMYYNGFILFAIFLGHTIGYFVFGRDTCNGALGDVAGKTDSGCAC